MQPLWIRMSGPVMRRLTAGARASLVCMMSVAAVVAAESASAQSGTDACQPDQVTLRGPWGQTQFTVEIADSIEERAEGLMHRPHMARGAGMLFVYEAPQRASFWMKNTLIPLDMLFVDVTGTVRHIHHRAIPGDLTPIPGGDNVFAVLEINGGLAARYGISVGTELRHEVFSKTGAIWPC
ncbi:DUF192 domain-containing protein [Phaeobacter gallaeciensis]|uniref:DUF192 domain-containing protein n=1 Tax=Phaeobacter gallaeciensis TaxID=60890 RepID=A0AAD0EB75_9RHOB|nr:DUF192 domain-containing protein [Phaeobacter gallaeciensis]AHD09424.1 Uncharacterized protein Gal_01665 [Phaeobacter gallaeciensis DSM 26640]ATE92687.1 hypothetical protein PhaeoP11_01656 [Phaeobacter gallaeciensis]ATE97491.1 hypothetical protein PhaeoP73_02190 [Phaeobacter gallaeciensis]ATF01352.1 hypothetical protein PhaeoP75_01706 [Phaeobacter gallaeciensis]ATF05732.1 hypothetical protein PhaeoP63_01654 [Phaeobacter gallaeciensis]